MTIKVRVKLLGILQKLNGKDQAVIELKEPIAIGRLIQNLVENFSDEFKRAIIDPELDDPRPNVLILVNGREISALEGLETNINDADEITIVAVTHGG